LRSSLRLHRPKTLVYTEASADAAPSPIAEKQVVTDVKWLGAHEKSREFPAEAWSSAFFRQPLR
jgi:hypothetical protein